MWLKNITCIRTTVDIDPVVLGKAKALACQRGKTLGETLSLLLAQALAQADEPRQKRPFRWSSQPMGALIDLEERSVGSTLLAYIADLLSAGMQSEAAVVGTVLDGLLRSNNARL